MTNHKLFHNLEDCLLRGEKLHIEIDFDISGGDPVVDISVERDNDIIFSDLSFDSLDEALDAADNGVGDESR